MCERAKRLSHHACCQIKDVMFVARAVKRLNYSEADWDSDWEGGGAAGLAFSATPPKLPLVLLVVGPVLDEAYGAQVAQAARESGGCVVLSGPVPREAVCALMGAASCVVNSRCAMRGLRVFSGSWQLAVGSCVCVLRVTCLPPRKNGAP